MDHVEYVNPELHLLNVSIRLYINNYNSDDLVVNDDSDDGDHDHADNDDDITVDDNDDDDDDDDGNDNNDNIQLTNLPDMLLLL